MCPPPKKRDHFERKFHLPTIDFQGDMLVFWGNRGQLNVQDNIWSLPPLCTREPRYIAPERFSGYLHQFPEKLGPKKGEDSPEKSNDFFCGGRKSYQTWVFVFCINWKLQGSFCFKCFRFQVNPLQLILKQCKSSKYRIASVSELKWILVFTEIYLLEHDKEGGAKWISAWKSRKSLKEKGFMKFQFPHHQKWPNKAPAKTLWGIDDPDPPTTFSCRTTHNFEPRGHPRIDLAHLEVTSVFCEKKNAVWERFNRDLLQRCHFSWIFQEVRVHG